MNTEIFTFLSGDQKTQIHCVVWIPQKQKIKGVLQIVHGMTEYIERYNEFAEYMVKQGYLVVGHDHLGHGESVNSPEDWGYFAQKNSSDILIYDIHKLRKIIQKKYGKLPYYILGHSMGSFLLRKYLGFYFQGLQGAIIMGTGHQPKMVLVLGKLLCKGIAVLKGWRYRCKFIHYLAFAGNNSKFRGESLKYSWLTRDTAIVKAYCDSPKCTFCFTLNGFYCLFDTMCEMNHGEIMKKIPKNLPLLFISGKSDPVGNFGKGVIKTRQKYRKMGFWNISLRLYPKCRHEILNELNRKQVYDDIFAWMKQMET